MRVRVSGLSAWTPAGDLDALCARVDRGGSAFSDTPPYPADGLSNARCGRIPGLDRERPAEDLLRAVVRGALADAGAGGRGTGLVVGTASGNVCGPWERWHRAVSAGSDADERDTGRDAPARRIAAELGLDGPVLTLSVACVSGTAMLALAEGWLRDGRCARVVAAGVDALSLFVHAGFSGLGALSASVPRPFRPDRDGLLVGEGAAALVLEPGPGGPALLGVGLGADAVHLTAPDREAGGAIRSARQALARAGRSARDVDIVSVHGTGTPYNDAMEQVALDALWGRPVDPFGVDPALQLVKACIGHTMGAAGAIEAAVAVRALADRPGAALSLSSAFGGMNAAAVFGPGEPVARAPIPTVRGAESHADERLRDAWPEAPLPALRANATGRAALAATRADVLARGPLPEGAALVLSTRTGCRATDLEYHARVVAEGAGAASRLLFSHTVPASPIAEVSLRFGVRGPMLCVFGDAETGRAEAERLVRHGFAPAALALDVEGPEPGAAAARATRIEAVRADPVDLPPSARRATMAS